MFCTGDMTILGNLYGWSPYFCAGRVNGFPTQVPNTSIGRVGYTVWRPGNFAEGVYEIRFDTAAPSNNYVVTLTQQGSGSIKI
jgi:hypothetical protein